MEIVSLGAGVQSTAVLLMAAHGEFEIKPDYAIFADTGWEPKAVYDHVDWLIKQNLGIEIIVVSAGNIREDIMNGSINQSRTANMPFYVQNGETLDKGIVPRGCTGEYKIQAINRKARELLGYRKRQRIPAGSVNKWMGISTDEIYRVKNTDPKSWEQLRYPLIEKSMNRLDCMNWLTRNGYKIPQKSSCIGCPFHNDRSWLELKRSSPTEWDEAVEFERTIQENGLRGMRGKVYLHKSCVPLDQVDLNENQMDIFDDGFMNECAGVCGV